MSHFKVAALAVIVPFSSFSMEKSSVYNVEYPLNKNGTYERILESKRFPKGYEVHPLVVKAPVYLNVEGLAYDGESYRVIREDDDSVVSESHFEHPFKEYTFMGMKHTAIKESIQKGSYIVVDQYPNGQYNMRLKGIAKGSALFSAICAYIGVWAVAVGPVIYGVNRYNQGVEGSKKTLNQAAGILAALACIGKRAKSPWMGSQKERSDDFKREVMDNFSDDEKQAHSEGKAIPVKSQKQAERPFIPFKEGTPEYDSYMDDLLKNQNKGFRFVKTLGVDAQNIVTESKPEYEYENIPGGNQFVPKGYHDETNEKGEHIFVKNDNFINEHGDVVYYTKPDQRHYKPHTFAGPEHRAKFWNAAHDVLEEPLNDIVPEVADLLWDKLPGVGGSVLRIVGKVGYHTGASSIPERLTGVTMDEMANAAAMAIANKADDPFALYTAATAIGGAGYAGADIVKSIHNVAWYAAECAMKIPYI